MFFREGRDLGESGASSSRLKGLREFEEISFLCFILSLPSLFYHNKIRLHNKFIKNYRKKLLKSFYVVYNNYIEMTDEKGGFAHEDYLFRSHT